MMLNLSRKRLVIIVVICLFGGFMMGITADYVSMQYTLSNEWDYAEKNRVNQSHAPYQNNSFLGMSTKEFDAGIDSLGINSSAKFKEYYINQVIPLMKDSLFSSNQLQDIIGTNETKQEWAKHFCNNSTGNQFYELHVYFCETVNQNGVGYLGFNQTGGFADGEYNPFGTVRK